MGSLTPSPLPRQPGWERVGPDKVLHLLGHGVLGVSLVEALSLEGFDRFEASALAMVLSTALGVVIGSFQRFVPGRAAESADTVAGIIGSLLGVLWWRKTQNRSVEG